MVSEIFYRVVANPTDASRWSLGALIDSAGNDIDPRIYTQGVRLTNNFPHTIKIRRAGLKTDFNFGDFDTIVVTEKIGSALNEFCKTSFQIFTISVEGSDTTLLLLNICNLVSCIDEKTSEYMKWLETDSRPEKIGQYRMITKLKIDPIKSTGHDIFRIQEWPIAVIVSSKVKILIESYSITGVAFLPVC